MVVRAVRASALRSNSLTDSAESQGEELPGRCLRSVLDREFRLDCKHLAVMSKLHLVPTLCSIKRDQYALTAVKLGRPQPVISTVLPISA